MSHGLPDVTLQSTPHEVILHGLREATSEHQVIPHAPSITLRFNGPKWQEMHNIHLLYNKSIVYLCFGRHGLLLNSKLNYIDLRPA